ncbi:Dihydroorotase [Zhongshania aliphaticivorans]|uniref:Dihydroorotase n=1 Tax=Zhongshania aliphaticivorans TaxID=1470434 RepID=A0A5S9N1A8_9GAMM|nr:dihydroorotase [Zhongshania aliphaticivorans]CAA0082393.1 Dihydroorotase [Zhongshania aliphaticivorans]CAA0084340.1 Dihydroorotase [Zhongshania aliphaticivorans]
MQTLEITRPDDWHIHLRDGDALPHTVADASRYFGRAIVMPNLTPPVRNLIEANAYRQRIIQALPTSGHQVTPLMVLYLTDNTTEADIADAAASDTVFAAKLYPAGATTNSDSGVTSIEKLYPVIAAMEKYGLPLLVHGEVTDADIDIFDREARFIERHLTPIATNFPDLKMVLEHITTADAAQFVSGASANIAATITAHHMLYNRNHMLAGGIRPHYYCLPILKRNTHQQALINAATSGSPKFFLGTDSAPHARHRKETDCGCAGCYTAYAAIELYAEAFEAADKLDKLEAFASFYGPDFYGLPRNSDTIILHKNSWTAPEQLPLGSDTIYPLRGGEQLQWQLA